MDDVMTSGAHARPVPKRDLLWVLVLIAACALLEVWGSWLVIGSETGFPRIGGMTTGWILPVSTEAYWACAGYAWLASPAGPRSRRFAMWSALGMIVLSLAGQESDHLLAFAHRTIPPVAVVMLVTALPLVALVLIAILIHLRHLDRADAAEADERTAVQAEADALRARVDALTGDLDAAVTAHADAERRAAEALTRAEALTQKLAAKTAQGKRSPAAQDGGRRSAQEVDLTTEARALTELDKNPSLRGPRMGGELARRLGVSAATGRRLHAKLTAKDPAAGPLSERSADRSGERQGGASS